MFKFIGSLAVVLALVAPVFATHCNERVIERVVAHDYGYQNVQAIVLVPHNKIIQRVEVQGLDYQPIVRERIIERVQDYPVVEKVIVRDRPRIVEKVVQAPVRVVEKVVNRPRLRVKQRIVQKDVVQVQKVITRDVVRQRIVNGY